MKTMIIRDNINNRTVTVTASSTYREDSGNWIANVDSMEMRRACHELCEGIEACVCSNLYARADLDDDGREYRLVSC